MEKKILLAVGDSLHSKDAVRYAAKMSSFVKDLSYTLLNMQPAISQVLLDEAKVNVKAEGVLDKIKAKSEKTSQAVLEKLKEQMVGMGIDANRIEVNTQIIKAGLAKDILEHAQKKLYDAIVVGRRGGSRVQEMFMGSLANKLVEHSKVIPVWVVDGEVTSEKIMIATDGSESALRALDHFAFMVSDHPDVKITLFHVVPKLRDFCKINFDEQDEEIEDIIIKGDKRCVEKFLVQAHETFRAAGIRQEQLDIKEAKAIVNVGKAIIEEAKSGDYGTVIVGRRGTNKAFFMGSVSKYVLDKTSDRAFWLIP